jgi:Cu(I)/Ag(I) efflux system membrane protein CusA/SilA
MIARLSAWCARRHWLVISLALLVAAAGELARRRLSRDVVPELADPQIGLVADWMGHPAPEVATAVTQVLTRAFQDIPHVKAVRGLTMSGMAYVATVFDSDADLDSAHRALQRQLERTLPKLPANVRVQLGPSAASTGWIFAYALSDPLLVSSALDLRRFQDTVLRPAIAAIPGVAEVASVGGDVSELRVDVKPLELRARGLAFTDVLAALRPVFEAGHGVASATPAGLAALPVLAGAARPDSTKLADVALVRLGSDMPTGLADVAGVRAVGGIVIARRGADVASVIEQVKRTLAREYRRLPHRAADSERLDSGAAADVRLVSAYDRVELTTRVQQTLLRSLGEEIAVVVLVILLFLLHGPSALVPLVTLPVVLLMTFGGMWILDVQATIMSLGGMGIALGMAADAEIVALEAAHRRRESLAAGGHADTASAATAFTPAILTSLLITALSFLPVLAFSGETGRLLRPLALTKTLMIASAALVTLTLAPALRDRLLRGRMIAEFANPLTRNLVRLYRPFVHFALRRPAFTLATALLALASCVPLLSRLGGEFMPRIDEGDLLYMPTTLPGVDPSEAGVQLAWQDHAISKFGEVASVFGKVGRAETGTDPAPYSMAETTVRLRPREQWPKIHRTRWYSAWAPAYLRPLLQTLWPDATPRSSAELVDALDRAVRLPGWTGAWTTPARARMDMLATGVRTPVGVRIVAPDPERLDALGASVRTILQHLPGTRSAVLEALGGQSWLDFDVDESALARQRVAPALLASTTQLMATGGQLGELDYAGRRMRVRIASQLPDVQMRGAGDQLRDLTVRSQGTASTQPVPLALLGQPSYVRRPAALRTERGELCAYLYVDLERGVDIQRYVRRAQRALSAAVVSHDIRLQPGERFEWTGQYELLIAGQQRLRFIVPLVLVSMLGLLFWQFRSLSEALLVLVSVPFGLVGSVWTLYLLGYPLSPPVWVGLLSLVGLAMQTGVVMVVYIDEAFYRRLREQRLNSREDIVAAHAEGTVQRLRPKIMTISTMAAGLLPLLWADGAGAEIMRRVAAPMLGGLLTSAFLTLEVLPVLYTIWRYRQLKKAQRLGVPLERIVGTLPAWARH